MTELSPSGAAANQRVDRWPRAVAASGVVAAGTGCLLTIVYLVRRPPCPPNYVRLIDFGLILLVLQGFALVAEVAVGVAARRRGPHRVAGVFAVVLGVAAVVLFVAAAALARATFGATNADTGCWTF